MANIFFPQLHFISYEALDTETDKCSVLHFAFTKCIDAIPLDDINRHIFERFLPIVQKMFHMVKASSVNSPKVDIIFSSFSEHFEQRMPPRDDKRLEHLYSIDFYIVDKCDSSDQTANGIGTLPVSRRFPHILCENSEANI